MKTDYKIKVLEWKKDAQWKNLEDALMDVLRAYPIEAVLESRIPKISRHIKNGKETIAEINIPPKRREVTHA